MAEQDEETWTQKAPLWKPCLADQQGSLRGLQDTEVGWESDSSGKDACLQDKPPS